MGAFRQPAHDVFGADDRHHEALRIPVYGRAGHQSAGFQKVVARGQVGERVCHMLDHLHVEDNVELLA